MALTNLELLLGVSTVGLFPFVPFFLRQRSQVRAQGFTAQQLNDVSQRYADLGHRLQAADLEGRALQGKLEQAQRASESLLDDIATLREENRRLRLQLEQPNRNEVRYGIATIGVSQCGKTAVTLPWANQLARPEAVKATVQFARYERAVSRVYETDGHRPVDHIFEIHDWGGEHVEDALTALVKLGELHALLIVVDLGYFDEKKGSQVFSQERINRQIEEFDKHVLRFFFSPAVVAHCKHYILFINKTDILAGLPDEIEKNARTHYKPLIEQLEWFSRERGVNFTVMAGSAQAGTKVQALFRHLIESLLPLEAQGPELRQEIEAVPRPVTGKDRENSRSINLAGNLAGVGNPPPAATAPKKNPW